MKKKVVIGLLVLLVGLIILSVRSCHRNEQSRSSSNTDTVTQQSTKKKSSTSESEVLSAQDEATQTLEKSDEPLGEEETQKVNASLTVAFDYLIQVNNQSDVQVTYKDKLSVTSQAMAQTIVTMLKAGYHLDITTLKVYASDSENVYQFTVDLTKDGAENLSLAGNYVTGTQQLEIASLHGIPTGIQY
ncbi:hypothetical protein [Streptococcus gallolyticus]|uniref:hypothetical protein n=1 Tax=Streptococcus gallolyticus TaxID=315405 RepID=UPI000210B848|nr:hypothetical protein [Streptococcus gallolyticus]BAK27076.1 predicted lipoprotein [Streptococcus gallolyticus subsp. gallolyticus ATCC 43143]